MEIQALFSAFCSVQHRLAVSPQSAALFFYLLGELSASNTANRSIAIANSRICGTIHTTPATLRKCRDLLIAAGIISFSSADGGKTPALYTVNDPEEWLLDVIPIPPAAINQQPESQEITPKKEANGQVVVPELEATAALDSEASVDSRPENATPVPACRQKLHAAADALRHHVKKPIKLIFRGKRPSAIPQFRTQKGAAPRKSTRYLATP